MTFDPSIWGEIGKALLTGVVAPSALLFGQWLIGRSRRPRLEVSVSGGRGHRVRQKDCVIDGELTDRVWLRVRVANVGKRTARNCQLFMSRYGPWHSLVWTRERLAFDPAPLIWSHSEALEPAERILTSLPPNTHRFADFAFGTDVAPTMLRLMSTTTVEQFQELAADNDGLEVEFLVVDDEGNSAAKTARFVWDGTTDGLHWA